MDNAAAKKFHKELNDLIAAFAKENGLVAPRGVGFTYSAAGHVTVRKFEMVPTDGRGTVETREFRALKAYYPELVNKVFMYHGRQARIIGYNTRAHKNPAQFRYLDEPTTGKFWVTGRHLFDTARAA